MNTVFLFYVTYIVLFVLFISIDLKIFTFIFLKFTKFDILPEKLSSISKWCVFDLFWMYLVFRLTPFGLKWFISICLFALAGYLLHTRLYGSYEISFKKGIKLMFTWFFSNIIFIILFYYIGNDL